MVAVLKYLCVQSRLCSTGFVSFFCLTGIAVSFSFSSYENVLN